MDDARSLGIIATAGSERQELTCECPGANTRARVHGETCRLVHNEEMLVLEQHWNGCRLRLKSSRNNRKLDVDHRAGLQAMALGSNCAVDENGALQE